MPLIAYACECSNVVKKFTRTAKDAPSFLICATCGKNMKKLLSGGSSSSKIVVDNGFQARQVEINPDIVEINEARAHKNLRDD